MSMTRKDYIVLAEALRAGLLNVKKTEFQYKDYSPKVNKSLKAAHVHAYKQLMSIIVKSLDAEYDNFNMDKFLEWIFKSED